MSGEALMGKSSFAIDPEVVDSIAGEIRDVAVLGVQLGIVIGGGNIVRGVEAGARGMDRTSADYMGMLATVINSLALQSALEHLSVPTRVQTAIEMKAVAEPFIQRRAIRHMEKGRGVIFAAVTGNPYFTTDTAAALRAIEIGAEALLMAKNSVDGVYTADPRKVPDAKKFDKLTHFEAINQRLQVMDATAFSLFMENKLPVVVFNLTAPESIEKVASGEQIGTLVYSE